MKTLVIIVATILAFNSQISFANMCETTTSKSEVSELVSKEVPKELKDAKYIIRYADGEEAELSTNEFKLVKRVQEKLVRMEKITEHTSCNKANQLTRPNRLSLLAGHGAQAGLNTSSSNSVVEVESKVGFVGGVMYQRMLTNRLNLGVQVQSSETALGIIGLDF